MILFCLAQAVLCSFSQLLTKLGGSNLMMDVRTALLVAVREESQDHERLCSAWNAWASKMSRRRAQEGFKHDHLDLLGDNTAVVI